MGFDLDDHQSIELKVIRTRLENAEFPGLYFDVKQSDSESYFFRYKFKDAGVFDALTLDTWYNGTAGNGDTLGARKQTFVTSLLAQSFNLDSQRNRINNASFRDESTTNFAERSIGYRFTAQYGKEGEAQLFMGTDLNAFSQSLNERINFFEMPGRNANLGPTLDPRTNMPLVTTASPGFDQFDSFIQLQSIPKSNAVDAGLFVEASIPVAERLKLKSGARLDFVRTSTNRRLITGNFDLFGPASSPTITPNSRQIVQPSDYSANLAYNRNPNLNIDRNFVLPAAFLTSEYEIDDHTKLFLGYGHSQRAPTLTELYASGPFIGVLQAGTSRLIGDPFLSPEKLNQFDVGVSVNYDRVTANARGFYAFIHDYITYDRNKGGQGLTQVVYSNTNLATLAGGEIFVKADPTDWFTPFGTLSYVQGIDQTHNDRRRNQNLASSRRSAVARGEFSTDTEGLPQIPPLDSRVGFRVHNATDPRVDPNGEKIWWQVEFNVRMVAGQLNVADSLREATTPGFTTFNLSGYLKVRENLIVTAGVENIGDLLYREHLDPISSTILRGDFPNVAPLFRAGTNFTFTTSLTY